MLTKEEFKKEYIRMMDSVRDPESVCFGEFNCQDVVCDVCPLGHYPIDCNDASSAFDVIEAVEKWSKENPITTNPISNEVIEALKRYSGEAEKNGYSGKQNNKV